MENQNPTTISSKKSGKHTVWLSLLVAMFFLLIGEVLSSIYTDTFVSFSPYFIPFLILFIISLLFAAHGYYLILKHNNKSLWYLVVAVILTPYIMLILSSVLYGFVWILLSVTGSLSVH
jgi:RsiW-degrading membrane proteinase PrsW (M82 family)